MKQRPLFSLRFLRGLSVPFLPPLCVSDEIKVEVVKKGQRDLADNENCRENGKERQK